MAGGEIAIFPSTYFKFINILLWIITKTTNILLNFKVSHKSKRTKFRSKNVIRFCNGF